MLCSLIYVDRVVQQDLLYENHKCPCVASAKCLCPKTKSTLFRLKTRRCWRVIIHVFELRIQSKTGICIWWNSLEKGSGIHKKRRCFYLCVMSNAFIFDGFLSIGDICFSIYISKNRGVVLIDVLFQNIWE